MRQFSRPLEWALATAEAAVVILSGVAVYRLLGGGDAGVTALIVVLLVVGAAWVLLLNPWSRWALPRLTRAVVLATLSVVTAIGLVMTGLFWWAALLVLGAVLLVCAPVLAPAARRAGRHAGGRRARR